MTRLEDIILGPFRPTAAQLAAAKNATVPDLIRPGLKVLFCGINPGLYSAAVGHHFARPGNRFWPAIWVAGFTERLLSPFEERELLKAGFGITNVAPRATAAADELSNEELVEGAKVLEAKVRRYKPGVLAVLGVGAYRTAFGRKSAKVGRQAETVGGVPVWILPNPSGLNAHYHAEDLARLFRELREAADQGVRVVETSGNRQALWPTW